MAIELLEHQAEFIESDFVHTGIVGGFRSGKSHAGVIKTVKKKLAYPGINVGYYLPTYGLIKDIAYPKFKTFLSVIGLNYILKETEHRFITPYGDIIMRSMDNPSTIVGYEVGYSLIDEADILPFKHMELAFKNIVARLSVPLPDKKANSLDFVSTPEGFRFMYDFFVKKPHQNKKLIKASTENNPFISESFIETLKMSYTEQQLEAYLSGNFVNLTSGNVYHKFDRKENHSDRMIQPRDVLHIGMDFNITKMSAVIHVIDPVIGGIKLTAVDEVVNAYDTQDMINIIKEKYKNHQIIIYPDASGQSRKTSSSTTDHDMLKKAGFKLVVDESNPSVRDRVTKMNMKFKDNNGMIFYCVNTNTCPSYTEALEQLDYKNGQPNKENGLDHVTEAGGYCVWHVFKDKKSFKIYS